MVSKSLEVRRKDIRSVVTGRLNKSSVLLAHMGISPELYAEVLFNAMFANSAIVDCSTDSIQKAVIKSINARLLPDGDQAAIIPFGKEAV